MRSLQKRDEVPISRALCNIAGDVSRIPCPRSSAREGETLCVICVVTVWCICKSDIPVGLILCEQIGKGIFGSYCEASIRTNLGKSQTYSKGFCVGCAGFSRVIHHWYRKALQGIGLIKIIRLYNSPWDGRGGPLQLDPSSARILSILELHGIPARHVGIDV